MSRVFSSSCCMVSVMFFVFNFYMLLSFFLCGISFLEIASNYTHAYHTVSMICLLVSIFATCFAPNSFDDFLPQKEERKITSRAQKKNWQNFEKPVESELSEVLKSSNLNKHDEARTHSKQRERLFVVGNISLGMKNPFQFHFH